MPQPLEVKEVLTLRQRWMQSHQVPTATIGNEGNRLDKQISWIRGRWKCGCWFDYTSASDAIVSQLQSSHLARFWMQAYEVLQLQDRFLLGLSQHFQKTVALWLVQLILWKRGSDTKTKMICLYSLYQSFSCFRSATKHCPQFSTESWSLLHFLVSKIDIVIPILTFHYFPICVEQFPHFLYLLSLRHPYYFIHWRNKTFFLFPLVKLLLWNAAFSRYDRGSQGEDLLL